MVNHPNRGRAARERKARTDETAGPDDVVLRSQVMWLIEQAIKNSSDDEPPRHVLSVLWGKVRDLTDADTRPRRAQSYSALSD